MSIDILVRRCLLLDPTSLSDEEMERVRSEFTYDNPEFFRRQRNGNPTGDLTARFRTFGFSGERMKIFRGTSRRLAGLLGNDRVRFVDRTTFLPSPWPGYLGTLRGYQERASNALGVSRQGIVVGGCGSGKTEILLAAAALTGQRTLVVVDSVDLQRQWRDRYVERFAGNGEGLTLIGGDGPGDGPLGDVVTIATAQTIRNRQDALDGVGCIVADEVHLWAARTFRDVVARCPAHFRFGATATLQRADGLVPIIVDTFGDVVYEVSEEELSEAGVRQEVGVRLVRTPFTFDMTLRWNPRVRRPTPPAWDKIVTAMVTDNRRHAVVRSYCLRAASEGSTLVLSTRRDYAVRIGSEMASTGIRVASVLGGSSGRASDCLECGYFPRTETKEKVCPECDSPLLRRGEHNEKALDLLRRGEIRAVVATSVADKGLDVPNLERAVVVLPTAGGRGTRLSARFQQQLGRLARVVPGKASPILYYLSDEKLSFARDRSSVIRRELGSHRVSWAR